MIQKHSLSQFDLKINRKQKNYQQAAMVVFGSEISAEIVGEYLKNINAAKCKQPSFYLQ